MGSATRGALSLMFVIKPYLLQTPLVKPECTKAMRTLGFCIWGIFIIFGAKCCLLEALDTVDK